MTQEELKQYRRLHKRFVADCKRVAKFLSDYSYFCKDGNVFYATSFEVNSDKVHWSYDDYCYEGYFPLEYLTMTKEQLEEDADKRERMFREKKWKKEDRRKMFLLTQKHK